MTDVRNIEPLYGVIRAVKIDGSAAPSDGAAVASAVSWDIDVWTGTAIVPIEGAKTFVPLPAGGDYQILANAGVYEDTIVVVLRRGANTFYPIIPVFPAYEDCE